MNPKFKSGFVALVGRPNAGKSTFLNACAGAHLAPSTPVAQTTRHVLRAVIADDVSQIILVDTPGIHKPKDELGSYLNEASFSAAEDADVVVYALSADAPFGKGDAYVVSALKALASPKCLLITKADLASQEAIDAQLNAALNVFSFDTVAITSAKTGQGIEDALCSIRSFLPEGPLWYPPLTKTDVDDYRLCAEAIEEQVLLLTNQEIPHASTVCTNSIEPRGKDLLYIAACVYTETESQKAIVVGKGGARIKEIGKRARVTLERTFGKRVYLDVRVKVRKKWRKDVTMLKELGF